MPLLAQLGLAWMLGIALAQWFELPWPVIAMVGLLTTATLFLYRQTPQLQRIALLALALATGAFRFAFFQPVFDPGQIAFYNDQPEPAKITGLVVDEPDVRDNYINLRLQAESIWRDGGEQPVEGLILVRAPRYPERAYGDRLSISGRLETPPEFEDFSYKDYLARFGIHTLVRRPSIELVEPDQGNPFWAAMLAFKARASAAIN
nr:ComEC/Rec2 family competence protein [Anaerolineae bacterium]